MLCKCFPMALKAKQRSVPCLPQPHDCHHSSFLRTVSIFFYYGVISSMQQGKYIPQEKRLKQQSSFRATATISTHRDQQPGSTPEAGTVSHLPLCSHALTSTEILLTHHRIPNASRTRKSFHRYFQGIFGVAYTIQGGMLQPSGEQRSKKLM